MNIDFDIYMGLIFILILISIHVHRSTCIYIYIYIYVTHIYIIFIYNYIYAIHCAIDVPIDDLKAAGVLFRRWALLAAQHSLHPSTAAPFWERCGSDMPRNDDQTVGIYGDFISSMGISGS
jgi:hypothetical protein